MAKIDSKIVILNNNKSSFQLRNNVHQCKICGASALHSNFGAITCSPCKMFFKRNAETGQEHFICDFNGNCEINIHNRHICSFCRLAKCFANGMQTQLIRCPITKKNSLPTLNLLKTDQSTLTIDQWNLFSNLMQCYDEHSGLSLAERYISEQNILPLKLRFKCKSVCEFVSSLFGKTQLLFEKNRHFRSLYSHDRFILLRHQMKYAAIISSSFIIRQSHLHEYPAFDEAMENLFQTIVIYRNKHAAALLCFDIPFLKLALAIISFFTFDYTINENISKENLTNIKAIIKIQDMYIELAWRYLVYVYDDKQAIHSFSNLIRCIFMVNNRLISLQDQNYFIDMINSVIQRTEQSLTVHIE